jgi:hypothetical protein
VNYNLLNITSYLSTSNAQVDDNSNRTSADVFQPAAMPTGEEVEQNGDLVDVYDLTSQFSIVPANGDSARVWLNVSITDGRGGTTDFYNTTQNPAVTSNGQALSVAALILFYPDTRGVWHAYTDTGVNGDTLRINGNINGTPVYAAVYTYALINIASNPPILSSIPGWIQYSFVGWNRIEDRAPTFVPTVPNVAMWEDDPASGQNLIDLTPFFTDDWDTGFLTYRVNYNQQPLIIDATVSGSWLSVSTLQAHYWGNVTLQVVGTDRGFDRVSPTADDHSTSSNYFVVNVRPVNDPPAITAIGGKTNTGADLAFNMTQGGSLGMTPTVADADLGTNFAFNVDTLPSFASFTAANGTLAFAPGNADVGSYRIVVTVTDGLETATVAVVITVTNVNDNPRFLRVGGVNVTDFPHTFAATQGVLFTLSLEVTDLDWQIGVQDNINFAADKVFISVTRSPVDYRLATATFTPTNDQVGLVTVVFSVTDGALGQFDDNITVPILVANANDAPRLESIGTVAQVYDITTMGSLDLVGYDGATQERTFIFTVTASDIDVAGGLGDALTISTSQAGKFTVTMKADGVTADISVRPNQTDAARGYIDFEVIVTDEGTPPLFASFPIHLGVTNINDAPVWTPVVSVELTEGVAFVQTFSAFDPDGDTLSYSAVNEYFSIDPATGTVDFTPTNELIQGADLDFDVTFGASDGKGGYASISIHFHIANVNNEPSGLQILSPTGAGNLEAGQSVTVRATAQDGDAGDQATLFYTWFIDEVEVATGANAPVVFANDLETAKTVTVRLMVEDRQGASANTTMMVTINGKPAPPKSPGFEAPLALAAAVGAAAVVALSRRRK